MSQRSKWYQDFWGDEPTMTESQKQEKKVLIKEYMKSDFNDFKESKEQEHYWDIIKE